MSVSHPPDVLEGLGLAKHAISAEQAQNYTKARQIYIEAAKKLLRGAKEYANKSSSNAKAAERQAKSYLDRADSLSQFQQQQQQQQQQPLKPKPTPKTKTASSSDLYRVASQLYASPPTNNTTNPQTKTNSSLDVPLINHASSSSSSSFTPPPTTDIEDTPGFVSKRCLLSSIGLFVLGVVVAVLIVELNKPSSLSPAPQSGTSPAPAPGGTPSTPSSGPCGPGPTWQLWNGMTDKSAWYDYIDVNVPVSKLPVHGVLSNGSTVELEIDVDMGGTSKRSSQLYANPEFQQHYDNLIREWNPSASTRSGTVDGCGFPIGKQADTSKPELEDFKKETCLYEDFNDGLNLASFRPLEQKACCERGPPESTVGCWIWANGTTFPKDCDQSDVGYKFNGNIGIEEMDVVYPHNTKPKRKNVLRLTSRNADGDICSDPYTNSSDKKKLCHKIIKSSGLVQTNEMYASARFDVVAKVPADRGLVWAIWTFHQEQHVPGKLGCDNYTCYADGFPGGQLGNETRLSGDVGGDGKEEEEEGYLFSPRTTWDDCCDTVNCCLDPTPPAGSSTKDRFLRAMLPSSTADQCAIPQSERLSNSTCACCRYNLDNNQFPHHKYNAPCCIASKQKIGPCTGPSTCDKDYYTDARSEKCNYGKDPQWLRNASMVSWLNKINHEIDIEIPASCYDSEVCGVAAGQCGLDIEDGKWCNTTLRDTTGCVQQFNTMNANNYRITTTGGTGHAYTNMCVKAHKKKKTTMFGREEDQKQEPFMLAGDGQYHKYTIDWHTGGADCEARVDFYVDDVLLATNNVMVPTRGSRFVFGSWGPEKGSVTSSTDKFNNEWVNFPDFWGNGVPGDGKSYLSHVYVSEVKITPHNEPNDIMYPATLDRKDGCEKIHGQEKDSCHQHWETNEQLGWKDNKIPAKMTGGGDGSMADNQCA